MGKFFDPGHRLGKNREKPKKNELFQRNILFSELDRGLQNWKRGGGAFVPRGCVRAWWQRACQVAEGVPGGRVRAWWHRACLVATCVPGGSVRAWGRRACLGAAFVPRDSLRDWGRQEGAR